MSFQFRRKWGLLWLAAALAPPLFFFEYFLRPPGIPSRAYFNINNWRTNFPDAHRVISGRRDGDASVCDRDPKGLWKANSLSIPFAIHFLHFASFSSSRHKTFDRRQIKKRTQSNDLFFSPSLLQSRFIEDSELTSNAT